MEERSFHPLDYVSVVRRRKWWFVVPLAVCVLVGALLALLLPREYKSEATIGITAPRLSPELLRGVSSFDRDERQRAISQQLLSRAVLERVVREEQIAPERPIGGVVDWLRSRVQVSVPSPIGRGDSRSGIDSFLLGFSDSNPERTHKIANRLAYVFVEENSRTRTEQAQNTSEVLAQQLRAAEQQLADIEDQLRAKKVAHMGSLPGQVNANLEMANGLRAQVESLSMQLRGEQDRLSMVESQLAEMRRGGTSVLTSSATSAIQAALQRQTALQRELAEARSLGYTDRHPEIIRIQGEMETARAELAAARKQDGTGGDDLLQADPAYRDKLRERDATRLRIASLKRAESTARAQIARYQQRVEAAPLVEQDVAPLERAHELAKQRYADLSVKHQAALTNEDLARKEGGERFSVLYPAGGPRRIKPNLLRVMLMSIVLGFGLGAALVVGREFLDRSVHDARSLQTEFEVPVLGEIPRIPAS
jgi:polysaccharide chain length determinant protein (PEP-CTERM system associated)